MQNFRPVVSAEYLGKFIHDTYVRPARECGDRVVTIRVREVCEALSHGYSENLVRGVLGSMKFRSSEEHTSELQSPCNLVCRLLLEKKKTKIKDHILVRVRNI